MENNALSLRASIKIGDPQRVAALLDAGADIQYQLEAGYDALIDAVYSTGDHLIQMLTLLIERGTPLNGMSTYGESAVRVLSHGGRFDAVKLLLEAGANPNDLELTELIEAVAFGSVADVNDAIRKGADLEGQDFWERTAWLIAVQTGEISKARILFVQGANIDARGRCGKPALFYAIENDHIPMLKWLLEIGVDIRQTNEFGHTALSTAAECDNLEAVNLLLEAGALVDQVIRRGTALSNVGTREVAMRLLEAGADPQELSREACRAILGFPSDADADLLQVSTNEFLRFRTCRFGTKNPEKMNNLFWEGMIRSGVNAYQAEIRIAGECDYAVRKGPIWCADRFGQSLTFLPDGRIVQIAGEHEDSYDRDFCIYNDVFVHDLDGNITIYGYPESVFPPTDFHTATLIGDAVYLIGSLGYSGTRRFGETSVYRLDMATFHMERLETSGRNPVWIYEHRAILSGDDTIVITGGKIASNVDGAEHHSDNTKTFILNLKSLVWE